MKLLLSIILLFSHILCRAQVSGYLFTAQSSAYQPVQGLSPSLSGDGFNPLSDEGFSSALSLGFSFNYDGSAYSTFSVSTNGLLRLGNSFTEPYFNNDLAAGGGRPLLAPLWDDLSLPSVSGLMYTTLGQAPNRVLVVQWTGVKWNFQAAAPVLSFQVRLYEANGIIEFIYDGLPGALSSPSASIGITGAGTGPGNFLSLGDAGPNPAVSSQQATDNIANKPAAGQLYRFSPPGCPAPAGISIANITTGSASLNWTVQAGVAGYQYAIGTQPNAPAAGTPVAGGPVSFTGLTDNTTYYIHLRTDCGGGLFSAWTSLAFTTACFPGTLPYQENFDGAVAPALPACIAGEDLNGGTGWRSFNNSNAAASPPNSIRYEWNAALPGDDWFFLRGMNLSGGVAYRLRFKYRASNAAPFVERMEIRYGSQANAAGMTAGLLFNNPAIIQTAYQDTTIVFTPGTTGVYYIGFHCYSQPDQAFLYVDDISLSEAPVSLPLDLEFWGEKRMGENRLIWRSSGDADTRGYGVERSADGISFAETGYLNSRAIAGGNNATYLFTDRPLPPGGLYYRLRVDALNGNSTYSRVIYLKTGREISISRVYPNPAGDWIQAEVETMKHIPHTHIKVFDLAGGLVLHRQLSLRPGINQFRFSLYGLAAGNYMLQVGEGGGEQSLRYLIFKR